MSAAKLKENLKLWDSLAQGHGKRLLRLTGKMFRYRAKVLLRGGMMGSEQNKAK